MQAGNRGKVRVFGLKESCCCTGTVGKYAASSDACRKRTPSLGMGVSPLSMVRKMLYYYLLECCMIFCLDTELLHVTFLRSKGPLSSVFLAYMCLYILFIFLDVFMSIFLKGVVLMLV